MTEQVLAEQRIGQNTEVTLHFALRLENGDTVDSTFDKAPATFKVGDGNLLPGFEAALFGFKAGDKRTLTVEPENAFGQPNPQNVQIMPRSQFADMELSEGLLVIEIPLRFLLFLMPSSRCVRSKVTLHERFVWNKDRTASVTPMFGMVLLAAVAVASTVIRWDPVDVILIVMDDVPLCRIGPFARISAVVLSFQVCNAMHVSGLGRRPPAVICWRSQCSWINTSNNLFLTMSAALLSRHGSPGGRRSWVSPNVLPLKL